MVLFWFDIELTYITIIQLTWLFLFSLWLTAHFRLCFRIVSRYICRHLDENFRYWLHWITCSSADSKEKSRRNDAVFRLFRDMYQCWGSFQYKARLWCRGIFDIQKMTVSWHSRLYNDNAYALFLLWVSFYWHILRTCIGNYGLTYFHRP